MDSILRLLDRRLIEMLHIDVQEAELSLLQSLGDAVRSGLLRFVLVSTHHASISGSETTHQDCLRQLRDLGAVFLCEHTITEDPVPKSRWRRERELLTDKPHRIIGLDLVRAAAIAMVLVAHMAELTATWWPATWVLRVGGLIGVETFFALSGFLVGGILYRSLVGGTLSLGRFWRRRWLRTVPAYVVFLMLNILFARRFYGATTSWQEVGTYLLYLQNLD